MSKPPKTIEIVTLTRQEHDEYNDEKLTLPSKYYFINSLGEHVFIKTRDRAIAQLYINENYGYHKFNLKTT